MTRLVPTLFFLINVVVSVQSEYELSEAYPFGQPNPKAPEHTKESMSLFEKK